MYKLQGLTTYTSGEYQLQPNTVFVCSVLTNFKELHERQISEFEHQLHQVIALPECERTVDKESGELIFQVKQGDTEQIEFVNLPPAMV